MQKNVHHKLVPDPLLILVNNPKQPLHARNSFKSKMFRNRIIKNPLKSQFYFFFLTQSLFMDKVIKNKTLQVEKQVQKNLLVTYYLTKFDDVI